MDKPTNNEYKGELTLEALASLDTYTKSCCNVAETSRRLNKKYMFVKHYFKQPYVREIFQLRLLQKGITPEKIAEVIKSGLEATNSIYHEGSKIADEPNWMARHRFVQLAAEIFEVLKYQVKVDNNGTHISNIIYNLNPDTISDRERAIVLNGK